MSQKLLAAIVGSGNIATDRWSATTATSEDLARQ